MLRASRVFLAGTNFPLYIGSRSIVGSRERIAPFAPSKTPIHNGLPYCLSPQLRLFQTDCERCAAFSMSPCQFRWAHGAVLQEWQLLLIYHVLRACFLCCTHASTVWNRIDLRHMQHRQACETRALQRCASSHNQAKQLLLRLLQRLLHTAVMNQHGRSCD